MEEEDYKTRGKIVSLYGSGSIQLDGFDEKFEPLDHVARKNSLDSEVAVGEMVILIHGPEKNMKHHKFKSIIKDSPMNDERTEKEKEDMIKIGKEAEIEAAEQEAEKGSSEDQERDTIENEDFAERENELALTLPVEVQRVGRLRLIVNKLSEKKRELMDKLTKQFEEENKVMLEELKQQSSRLSGAEENVRTLAVDKYNETKETNLDMGVKIQVRKSYEYDDQKAYNWATERKMCLTLDKKAFQNTFKAQKHPEEIGLGFVKLVKTPSATIPGNIKLEESGE